MLTLPHVSRQVLQSCFCGPREGLQATMCVTLLGQAGAHVPREGCGVVNPSVIATGCMVS